MKKILKEIRLKLKHFYYQKKLTSHDFSIISNNCWGTRMYQKFGLPYYSPFQSLFLLAPDYIKLLQNFVPQHLHIKKFISVYDSKYKKYLEEQKLLQYDYPIGILENNIELHFQHYTTADYAYNKWESRLKRINPEKTLFKFSDGYLATPSHIEEFNKLPFKNKICFTATPYKNLHNTIYMDIFKNQNNVELEWKYTNKYINICKLLNTLKPDTINFHK